LKATLPLESGGRRLFVVADSGAGQRLDAWLNREVRVLSGAQIKALIATERVWVNGRWAPHHQPLQSGDRVEADLPPPRATKIRPQDLPLDILYQDADIVVLNKAPGLLMHPAHGHPDGTAANALVHHCPDLIIDNERRPGLVHRLDRYTSGVLVVAKNSRAMKLLARQFKRRDVAKEYLALVWGRPDPPGETLQTLIGSDPDDSRRMAVPGVEGRTAITHYAVERAVGRWTLVRVRIETGRTHQIRVHLAYRGFPVVGDRVYGRAREGADDPAVDRQMLHAHRIRFRHPTTNEWLEFTAPLPPDFARWLDG